MEKINYEIKVRCWKDKSTGSWLIHSMAFDISAYGKTKSKAKQMFEMTLTEILKNTIQKLYVKSRTSQRNPRPRIR